MNAARDIPIPPPPLRPTTTTTTATTAIITTTTTTTQIANECYDYRAYCMNPCHFTYRVTHLTWVSTNHTMSTINNSHYRQRLARNRDSPDSSDPSRLSQNLFEHMMFAHVDK
jgi:hypothetical protein